MSICNRPGWSWRPPGRNYEGIRQKPPGDLSGGNRGKEEDREIFAGLSWTIGFNRRQQLEINRIKVDQGKGRSAGQTAVEDRVAAALADFELGARPWTGCGTPVAGGGTDLPGNGDPVLPPVD